MPRFLCLDHNSHPKNPVCPMLEMGWLKISVFERLDKNHCGLEVSCWFEQAVSWSHILDNDLGKKEFKKLLAYEKLYIKIFIYSLTK